MLTHLHAIRQEIALCKPELMFDEKCSPLSTSTSIKQEEQTQPLPETPTKRKRQENSDQKDETDGQLLKRIKKDTKL